MAKKKQEFAELSCPVCEENANLLAELSQKLRDAESRIQELQAASTRSELLLQKYGLSEAVQEISDVEVVCVGQIKRLLEFSALRPLTETEAKILDTLHKNLRMVRGEKVDEEGRKKMKAIPIEELQNILKMPENK